MKNSWEKGVGNNERPEIGGDKYLKQEGNPL